MTEANSITRLFEFFEQNDLRSIDKYEVCSTKFSVLRRSLRRMIGLLREEGDEEGGQLSDRLRALLSRWLTTPVEFDRSLLDSLESIGVGAEFESRWGAQIGTAYKEACGAARALAECSNPLQDRLGKIVEGLIQEGESFRIYCHRSVALDFQFLLGTQHGCLPLGEIFLHTPREYRETAIFDVLVKIGPLRSRGWGAVPDAVLTAPRFNRMVQIVWAGCQDEPDFGYDPANVSEVTDGPPDSNSIGGTQGMFWKTTTTQTGDDPFAMELGPDGDDFQMLSELGGSVDNRRCVLIQLGGQQAVLYPPRAYILSFDPAADADSLIDFRLPVDCLSEGMFVIEEHFHDSGIENPHAEEGKYSRIWKQHLVDKLLFDDDFSSKLRKEGIHLIHLEQSLLHWSKQATSVVHAPQRRKHFDILIRNLDIDYSSFSSGLSGKVPWATAAWHEVTKTRGEAIQTGMNEHRAADDRLLGFLESKLIEIQKEAAENDSFILTIQSDDDLPEMVEFHKIMAIEEGFRAPDGSLRTICDLEEIEQWRE